MKRSDIEGKVQEKNSGYQEWRCYLPDAIKPEYRGEGTFYLAERNGDILDNFNSWGVSGFFQTYAREGYRGFVYFGLSNSTGIKLSTFVQRAKKRRIKFGDLVQVINEGLLVE